MTSSRGHCSSWHASCWSAFLFFWVVTPIAKISFDAIGDVALIGKDMVAVNGREKGKRLLRTYSLLTGRKLSSA